MLFCIKKLCSSCILFVCLLKGYAQINWAMESRPYAYYPSITKSNYANFIDAQMYLVFSL